jgi:hypothetical protein
MTDLQLTWPGDGRIPKGDPSCWYRADLPYWADHVVYNAFPVVRETDATVWIDTGSYENCPEGGRRIGKNWNRRWAAPTPGGALIDLKARRKKQFDMLLSQLDDCVDVNRRLGQDFKGSYTCSHSIKIQQREAVNFWEGLE